MTPPHFPGLSRGFLFFVLLVVASALLTIGASALSASVEEPDQRDIEMFWSADELGRSRPSAEDIRLAAAQLVGVEARGDLPEPRATYADGVNDLLFKWLLLADEDYGLSAGGSVMRTDMPSQALGMPPAFYWQAVTFDINTANLSAFDAVPNSSKAYYNGSAITVSDGTSTTVPAYADMTQVRLSPNGSHTRWELTSRGTLPGLPEAYRLGYNNFIEYGSTELVQFIGATPFTAGGWRWSLRDRGNLFPWWSDDLDVVEVGVDSTDSQDIFFMARVDGVLAGGYNATAAWPRFEWFIDADNDLSTGDSFTFSYQEGSYVFRYDLTGIDAVASALYNQEDGKWIGILRKKVSVTDWQTLDIAVPSLSGDSVSLAFPRLTAGVQSTFRWGLVSSFDVQRGGESYTGRVDVAPNSGMKVETLPVDPNLLLAEKYAPLLYFANKAEIYPVDILYTLNNATLLDSNGKIIKESPGILDLSQHQTDNSYLDFKGDNVVKSLKIWNDGKLSDRMPTVLARVVDVGSVKILQYWFHYFYSQWGYTKGCNLDICLPLSNNHEGDWEMVQLVLENNQPLYAVYSQHDSASRRPWADVEKQGTRPVVYVGYGSHASYFKNSSYHQLGTSEETGVGDAPTLGIQLLPGPTIPPTDWLNFRGIWGANHHQVGGSARGPVWNNNNEMRSKWASPLLWGMSAEWDDEAHYGLLSRAFRATLDGTASRYIDIELRTGFFGNVIIGKDVNQLDPTERKAEFMLNCENDARQTILIHQGGQPLGSYLWFNGNTSEVNCPSTAKHLAAADTLIFSVEVSIPNETTGEVTTARYENVSLSNEGAAGVDMGSTDLALLIDQNSDGTIDETVPPSSRTTEQVDMNAPKAIDDLAFDPAGMLRWAAPSDNGPTGRAAAYEVRYAGFPVTEATWEYAEPIIHDLTPGEAGMAEVLPIEGLPPGLYFFAVRSTDLEYNASALSNTASGQIIRPVEGLRLFTPIVIGH